MDEKVIICAECGTQYYEEDGDVLCPLCGRKNG